MAPRLLFSFGEQRVEASGVNVQSSDGLQAVKHTVEAKLLIPADGYDLFDQCGKIDSVKDLQRSVHTVGNAGDCIIEVRERPLAKKLRLLAEDNAALSDRVKELEQQMKKMSDLSAEKFGTTDSGLAKLSKDVNEIRKCMECFDPAEFQKSVHSTISSEIAVIQSAAQADKETLTELVEETAKRCREDLNVLSDQMAEKMRACSIADLEISDRLNNTQKRLETMSQVVNDQVDNGVNLLEACISSFRTSADRSKVARQQSLDGRAGGQNLESAAGAPPTAEKPRPAALTVETSEETGAASG